MSYKGVEYTDIFHNLKIAFDSGKTKRKEWRISQLRAVIRMLTEQQAKFLDALQKDLRKDFQDSMVSEIAFTVNEAEWFCENLDSLMADQKVGLSVVNIGGTAYNRFEPLGVVLNITAWNYPVQIALSPLCNIIAAGNCCVIKPSEVARNVSNLLAEMVPKYCDNECIRVLPGGVADTTALLKLPWDHILYTGSASIGRIIYKAAAEQLIPCTLEMGGKCPTYVHRDCDLQAVANRICWTKFANAGQTCIANDYILAHEDILENVVEIMASTIREMYGNNPLESPDYGKIINSRHYERLCGLLDSAKTKHIVCGGDRDPTQEAISPTIVTGVSFTDRIMEEEIFGPLLPVLPVKDYKEAVEIINNRDKPLHLYVFTNDKAVHNYFIDHTSSGGITVNDCLVGRVEKYLGFGGVGPSGFGVYGGKPGFENFSHIKPVLIKSQGFEWLFRLMRYPPHNPTKTGRLNMIQTVPKKLMKFLKGFLAIAVLIGVGLAVYYGISTDLSNSVGNFLGKNEL